MTDTIHALAQQIIARDNAISHALSDQVAALRDTVASQIAAHDADVSERDVRHRETVGFLDKLHEAENAAATLRRDSIVKAFVEEIDRLTRLGDQVLSGEAILPVAARIRSEPPAPEARPMDPEFNIALGALMATEVEALPPEETHAKPKLARVA